MKKHFKPEFEQKVVELVMDKHYFIHETTEVMKVGRFIVNKWVRQ